MRGGVFDYILKPVIFSRFKEALESFREHRRSLQTETSLDQKDIDRLLHPYKDKRKSEPRSEPAARPLVAISNISQSMAS
jgi:response regulator of citrate/malate metabolism